MTLRMFSVRGWSEGERCKLCFCVCFCLYPVKGGRFRRIVRAAQRSDRRDFNLTSLKSITSIISQIFTRFRDDFVSDFLHVLQSKRRMHGLWDAPLWYNVLLHLFSSIFADQMAWESVVSVAKCPGEHPCGLLTTNMPVRVFSSGFQAMAIVDEMASSTVVIRGLVSTLWTRFSDQRDFNTARLISMIFDISQIFVCFCDAFSDSLRSILGACSNAGWPELDASLLAVFRYTYYEQVLPQTSTSLWRATVVPTGWLYAGQECATWQWRCCACCVLPHIRINTVRFSLRLQQAGHKHNPN